LLLAGAVQRHCDSINGVYELPLGRHADRAQVGSVRGLDGV
jgi:hypothetical protein